MVKRDSQPNNNIPPASPNFIDREDILRLLTSYVEKQRFNRLALWGEAGIGKTALAIKFAHYMQQRNTFDFIVWTTAKEKELDVISTRLGRQYVRTVGRRSQLVRQGILVETVEDLYLTILKVTRFPDYERLFNWETESLNEQVLSWLSSRRVFIVIDDLDSWQDWLSLMRFTHEVPYPSAVLFTTRRELSSAIMPGIAPIQVGPLKPQSAKDLFEIHLRKSNIQLHQTDINKVMQFSQGNALIISLIAGLIRKRQDAFRPGFSRTSTEYIDAIVKQFSNSDSVSKFLFRDLYDHLSAKAKFALQAVAVAYAYRKPPLAKDVERLSGMRSQQFQEAIEELQRAALVNRDPLDNSQVDLHDLTVEYVRSSDQRQIEKFRQKAATIFA